MTLIKLILMLAIILTLAMIVAGQLGMLRGKAPGGLGLTDGKLKRISKTENSASSQADLWTGDAMVDYARVAPLAYSGSASEAMQRLTGILQSMPGVQIVEQKDNYLYAQASTRLMKFIDDIEFAADDAAKVIHVRSASRLGRKDFGVNRARVETIRQRFVS